MGLLLFPLDLEATMLARPTLRRTASLAVTLLAFGSLAACGDQEGDSTATDPAVSDTPSPTPTPVPSETSSTEEPPEPVQPATVYHLIDTRLGPRLVREPALVQGEIGVGAVGAMLAGPKDPDYVSPWNPATQVLDVQQTDGVVTIDLSAEALEADVDKKTAKMMVQQLVWTATDALGAGLAVDLLIDGEPASELWSGVSWPGRTTRADADEVRTLFNIDSPGEGATMSSPLNVTGEASAMEANVPWRLLDEQGNEVDSGFTTAAEGMTLSPFLFTLELEPGTWTIEIAEDDMSGGEGGEPISDSRTFTVE